MNLLPQRWRTPVRAGYLIIALSWVVAVSLGSLATSINYTVFWPLASISVVLGAITAGYILWKETDRRDTDIETIGLALAFFSSLMLGLISMLDYRPW